MISVVMANYNSERFLRQSILSVLNQTVADIELIVSDDSSSDASVEIVRELARTDKRIRLLSDGSNGGPARARNRALDEVRGEWMAIVDSDDLLHPERFERLLALAARHKADMVADNLLHFQDDGTEPVSFLFSGSAFDKTFKMTPELFVRADVEADLPRFGYLKPIIRTRCLEGLRYDESTKIGEDYDFVLKLLLKGASFIVFPQPTYLYRRHGASISQRLSVQTVQAMIDSHLRIQDDFPIAGDALKTALSARLAGLRNQLRFERLVAAVKARRTGDTLGLLAGDPRMAAWLLRSAKERLIRQLRSRRADERTEPGCGPQTILLTNDADTAHRHGNADAREWLVQQVPPYRLPGEAEGDNAAIRLAAGKLADLCRQRRSLLICDGPAGRYAAGFVPFDHEVMDAEPARCPPARVEEFPPAAQAWPGRR